MYRKALLPVDDAADASLPALWHPAAWLVAGIVLACIATLGCANIISTEYPIVVFHALLAFVLGLRHAVDVDHLAAIDNVTRQLLDRGQLPVSVGFWFAAGHSTVVVALTAVLASGYSMAWHSINHADLTDCLELLAQILAVTLLGGIGFLNARVAVELLRDWVGLRQRSSWAQDRAAEDSAQASLRTAFTVFPFMRRAFGLVDRPIKMLGVGFLFGLSFDTATQVALIGLAAMSGTSGRLPPLVVMVFPLSFSCAMCLVDTLNGLLMIVTYSWANVRPVQKLFYNFLVTAMSAGIALVIGSLELLQMIGERAGLTGPFWRRIENVNMAFLGYVVIAAFAVVFSLATCCSCAPGRSGEATVPPSPGKALP